MNICRKPKELSVKLMIRAYNDAKYLNFFVNNIIVFEIL
jgi:hypothetical protein